jgi:hypothetical protein
LIRTAIVDARYRDVTIDVDSIAAFRCAELAAREMPGPRAVHDEIRILVPPLDRP